MKITEYETITRDQLLTRPNVLSKVIYHSTKTQIQLKDGLFTVASLIKLQNREPITWGA